MSMIETIEAKRVELQARLDSEKSQGERNKLGQFATPPALATQILQCARQLLPTDARIRFLDPGFGTGSFYSALLHAFPASHIASAIGFETDTVLAQNARSLWGDTALQLNTADFTLARPPAAESTKANLLICNPPYVRHHHLRGDEKLRLQRMSEQIAGIRLSGLAGLYCYFLCLSHAWMAKSCVAGWLIPSEFMDVNYGRRIKDYLLGRVTLLRIHRFDPNDMQFSDALVSSAVVWIRNSLPPVNHTVEFTYGGSLREPVVSKSISVDTLRRESKWTRFPFASDSATRHSTQVVLSDLFKIQRGLATGDNRFFILTHEQVAAHQIPESFLTPILPSPRYLPVDEVQADDKGNPAIDRKMFLLSCDLPEREVKSKHPLLWKYLKSGIEQGVKEGYICAHRSPWYSQENRPPSPFLCTYMGRQDTVSGRPFRFILNHSKATAPNVYLILYPKPFLQMVMKEKPSMLRIVWQALNQISTQTLTGEGRVYGGGLHKLEPKELGNVPADVILAAIEKVPPKQSKQLSLAMERRRIWRITRPKKPIRRS
jgi:adenine-specific DNA-methyltransferase